VHRATEEFRKQHARRQRLIERAQQPRAALDIASASLFKKAVPSLVRIVVAAIATISWVTLTSSAAGAAADKEGADPRVVRVVGEATVTAAPDHAQIDLGVFNQAPTANEAASENAKHVEKVLAAVRAAAPKAPVTTVEYSVSPTYGEYRPNEPPKVTGYSAQNIVRVATDELDHVSKILDAATGAGANNVRGLSFTLKNEAEVRKLALSEAVAKGRAQAEAIAAALGVKIIGVRSADAAAEPPIVRPMVMGLARAKGEAAAPTPVEPGTLDVHASVALAFDIAP
jgi:uncharacterized protein YggE